MRVQPSITSREVNQNSGQVFRAVREDHVIIPTLRESFAPVSSPHSRADEILAGMRSDRV